jgi:Skp family chaperone for outer membrane proteins
MKRIIIIAMTCVFIFTIILPVSAAEKANRISIAFADMSKVFQESKTGMEALKIYNAFIMSKKELLMSKSKEISDLQSEFNQQSSIMNDAAKNKLQDKINELKQEAQKIQSDTQHEAMEKQTQLFEPISKELKALLKTIAKEEGYSAIFQITEALPLHQHITTPDGNSVIVPEVRALMLYISDDADITNLVLKRYNNMKGK